MITKLTVVETDCTDVFVNQGVEKALFDSVSDGELVLYLWSNAKTVVVGRNQDAFRECKVDLLESEKGKLARRLSGGGAVFHDGGNVNYTFIAKSADYSVERNLKIVLCALDSLGIKAALSGRNDVEIDGAKVSGCAYYKKDGRELHHGTMLINSSSDDVARYLTPPAEKFRGRAVKSVKSRVTNLASKNADVTAKKFVSALINAVKAEYSSAEYSVKQPFELGAEAILCATAFFAADEWRYGKKQDFDLRLPLVFEGVSADVGITVADDIVSSAEVFTDSLDTELSARLNAVLLGMNLKTAVGEIAERIRGEYYDL